MGVMRVYFYLLALLCSCCFSPALGQNPLVMDQFMADPSARVFGDRVYVYPSHDIPPSPGKGRANWFVMEDYHVFSSRDLTNWTDHGMIVHQNKVPWVKPESYSMWAPDCIYRNGKYYFYFPSTPADTTIAKGFAIGVAVSKKPEGPFIPQAAPIKNVKGIDPNVFIDKDGQAYLYWSQGEIYGAKLKEDMLELDSQPVVLQNLPSKGLKEGPYLFERNGIYYMTYPHVENKIERLEYAIGKSPLGPFTFAGVIMDESPEGCWTNHHSIINFKDQWYLFYHHNDLSPNFDKNRSIRADSLFFNADGTIRKVTPTLRGVGLSKATANIQIDRYSDRSSEGVSVDFLDTSGPKKGWKATFSKDGSWLRYNSVDFKKGLKTLIVNASAEKGGLLEIRLNKINGLIVSVVNIPPGPDWKLTIAQRVKVPAGIQHLYFVSRTKEPIAIDWVRFE